MNERAAKKYLIQDSVGYGKIRTSFLFHSMDTLLLKQMLEWTLF